MKKNILKPRVPMKAVKTLRHKGGAHSSKKGGKGYERKKEKRALRKILQG